MAYISSSELHIFPASQRTSNTEDIWLSEYNLSSIVNQFMDQSTPGFVISKTTGANDPIEFNIKGYYFRVDKASSIVSAVGEEGSSETKTSFVTFSKSGNHYIATIYLGNNNGDGSPLRLLGDDEGSDPTSLTSYSLELFDSSYNIPATSRLSVVGLASVGGKGLTVRVKGSEIQSYTVEANSKWTLKSGQSQSHVKIVDGEIKDLTLDATSNTNNSRIKVVNGKITELVIDDGTL